MQRIKNVTSIIMILMIVIIMIFCTSINAAVLKNGTEYDDAGITLEKLKVIKQMANDNSYIRDADEFMSEEEYYKYLEFRGEIDFAPEDEENNNLDKDLFGTMSIKTVTLKNVSASQRITLNGILSPQTAIQSFYVGNSYLYTVQMGNVDDDGRADDIVLRCYTLSSDGNTATYSSMMKLVDFGHCQTLEYYTWNGTTYFLMSCRYTSTSYTNTNGNPYYWATEICRVHYNAGTQLSYALCDRLINIDRANYNGTSYGTVKRVDGALSTDKADLLIWCRSITNVMQFSVYSFDEINELWDSPGATAVSCNNSVVKEACLSAEYPTSGSVFRLTESSSMQGLELNNADYTFIANGSSNANMYIVKLNWDCDMVSTIKISNSALSAGHNMEIEGLQLKGDYVYFGVCNHNIQNTGVQYIYSVSKNAF